MSTIGKPGHYGLLDTVRGICIISMIAYHATYDIVNVVGVPLGWYHGWQGHLWQQTICWTFILLSGLCWQLSRHHLKRGLILVALGAVITLSTYFIMPTELIQYGVLTLLGLCTLLLIPLEKLLKKIPPRIGLCGAFLLFVVTKEIPRGFLGFEALRFMELPADMFQFDALAVLGFPSPTFSSSDYFPLLPWFFLFLTGYFLWSVLSPSEKALDRLRPGIAPLSFLGQHSLLLYILHQPLLMAVFMLFPN